MELIKQILPALMLIVALGLMLVIVAKYIRDIVKSNRFDNVLKKHFRSQRLDTLKIESRQFSSRIRADLLSALEQLLQTDTTIRYFSGVLASMYETPDLSAMLHEGLRVSPPQYDEIEVGDDEPVRCLKNGLWLVEHGGKKYAVFCGLGFRYAAGYPRQQLTVQVASSPDDDNHFAKTLLRKLERAAQKLPSYRGKVLSLELVPDWEGAGGEISVHKLRSVSREELILPPSTIQLLERNLVGFVAHREELGRLGMTRKKGVLFYGPPGTGKTHTIHYLAAALPGHTTLLISAEQIGLLGEYMILARLLQPSMVVIEDADLISRERSHMHDACEEVLLNKLLNEMDGLRPSADILFVLTTNRPETLERALSARPGRIDQAIEFPLPDFDGRRKLVRLYAYASVLTDELVEQIARRTEGVSASFIKELMRRATQLRLERNGGEPLAMDDVDRALDEMLFSGGTLNRKLLGANVTE